MHSIVIPAYREAHNLRITIENISRALDNAGFVNFEIIVIDDASDDGTADLLSELHEKDVRVKGVINETRVGFGRSVIQALAIYRGDSVTITMADSSDDAADVVRYLAALGSGVDCVFGSRFMRGSKLTGYPPAKYIVNRVVNLIVQVLFWSHLNDTTGAFKCYKRNVINGIQPLISNGFNITIEMPLKAISRGYAYKVIPINWTNQEDRISNLRLGKMAPYYLYSLLVVWLERFLIPHDFKNINQR